ARSRLASATTVSHSASPSAFQRGQSTPYISCRTYQPSSVTGAPLIGQQDSPGGAIFEGAFRTSPTRLEPGHAVGTCRARGPAPPPRLPAARDAAHRPAVGRHDDPCRGPRRDVLRARLPLARGLPAAPPPPEL